MTQLLKLNRKESGFTLIELAVVLVIVGVLAMLVMPTFARQRERAAEQAAVQELDGSSKQALTFHLFNGSFGPSDGAELATYHPDWNASVSAITDEANTACLETTASNGQILTLVVVPQGPAPVGRWLGYGPASTWCDPGDAAATVAAVTDSVDADSDGVADNSELTTDLLVPLGVAQAGGGTTTTLPGSTTTTVDPEGSNTPDTLMLVDYASGNLRWREFALDVTQLSSVQWGTANLNGTHRSQPVVGDWNGDGLDDWAVLHKSANNAGNWHFTSEFGPSLPAYWEVAVPDASNTTASRRGNGVRAFAGDWDGDGDDDYGLFSNVAGRVWLYNNGTGASTCWGNPATPPSNPWSSGCSPAASSPLDIHEGMSVAAGDWDGDGRDEVFLFELTGANAGRWQVRDSYSGALLHTYQFGPACGYNSTEAAGWYENCFAVVGDWDGDGRETPGLFLRTPVGSHPANRFFWTNSVGTEAPIHGQIDFPPGSVSGSYVGAFGYDGS